MENLKHNHRYHKKIKKNHPWRIGWAKADKDLRAVTEFIFEGKKSDLSDLFVTPKIGITNLRCKNDIYP